MSKLSIGLVTSPSEESDQLIKLLEELGIEITYHISPDEIKPEHIQAENLNVWLLNVNDDDWHDNIDQLLDESEASIYFNEPGNLSKQSHPQYWCKNLVSRLYELTGIDESSPEASDKVSAEAQQVEPQGDSLTSALDELETNSVGIPSEIAADLVSELETISPELEASIEESSAIDEGLKKVHNETISPDEETIEIIDVIEPEITDIEQTSSIEDKSLASEELAEMEQVNLAVEEVEMELEKTDLILEDDEIKLEQIDPEVTEPTATESTDELEISLESSPDEQIDLLDDFDSGSLDDSDLDLDEFELESTSENIATDVLDSSLQPEEIEPEEIESETADISDEIMQLADDDHSNASSESKVENTFEEIDLSVEVNPILESVREGNSKPSGSVFSLQDQEQDQDHPQDSKTDQQGSELQNREQAIEFLSDFDSVTNNTDDAVSSEEDSSELDFSLADEPNLLDEHEPVAPLDEDLGTELEFASEQELDLALSDAETQLESAIEPDAASEAQDAPIDFADGGLELESIEESAQQKVTGKAVFIEEQQEQQPATESVESDSADEFEISDGGLTLESIGNEPTPTTGKAQFVIDDEVKESDIQLESSTTNNETDSPATEIVEQSSDSQPKAEEQNHGLSLENQELSLESQDVVDNLESPLELTSEEQQSEVTMTDDAAELSDGLMDLDHELLDQSEPESFEIPMLDDAATGLDFEEPSQPVMQKTELCPCWVIGASLGGPAAVKRFLQSLPKDIDASFIITQHIDENFLPVLAEILTTSSQFEVKVANGSNPMTAGQIYLAPLNGKTIFLQDGSMLVDRSQKWSEPYSPCIDDVIESLSAVYKEKSGAIIFSGMGQDGLNGAKKMKALGGQIWAQSVDTCANPSMPDAVISEQLTDVVASPEMLAEQLAAHLAS